MTDQQGSDNSRRRMQMRIKIWWDRLVAVHWVLLLLAAALLVAISLARLTLIEGLVVFAIIVLAVLLTTRQPGATRAALSNAPGDRQTAEQAFGSLIEALNMPCIIIDERNIVRRYNGRAAKQFPRLDAGSPLAFAMRQPGLLAAVDECRGTHSLQMADILQAVPNQTWFRAAVAPLARTGIDTERRGWCVISLSDTTEARRIDTMRADFIAYASHELRTPLASLMGFIDTLRGPAAKDEANREKFLGIMHGQAERMSRLINDLLSLSRIEAHQHVAPTGRVDLRGLLSEVAEGLQPQAKSAGVLLRLDLPSNAAEVAGDRSELYEVFENIIDNAIKYGQDGETVDIALTPTSGSSDYAFGVVVTDHGKGVPAEHVPRLTERFYRVDPSTSREKKGTGLGLAIVKHIVNRHRGLMVIRSELGKGTSIDLQFRAE